MNIIFVCTGNTCRSPMGEYILKSKLKKLGRSDIKVSSMGTYGRGGYKPSVNCVDACNIRGIDIRGHRSRGLIFDELVKADIIFVMEKMHGSAINAEFPVSLPIIPLGMRESIPDPHGGDYNEYSRTFDIIEFYIEVHLPKILK